MAKLLKETKIKNEIERLETILSGLGKVTVDGLKSLIENAAFMSVSLSELQAIINQKGYTEGYQNGEHQKGVKKCSEVEIYIAMGKNHMSAIKQLTDLLPKEQSQEKDELMKFLSGNKK